MKHTRHPFAVAVAVVVVLTTVIGTAAIASADTTAPVDPAVTPAAPSAVQAESTPDRPGPKHRRGRHPRRTQGEAANIVDLKFVEGTDVRLRGGRLVSKGRGPIPQLDEVLARFPGTRVARLFEGTSEERHDQTRGEAIALDDAPQADLNLFFRLETDATTDTVGLIDALEGLDIVETAELAPIAVSLPVTPNYAPNQGYRNPATAGGIEADYAHTFAGGKGENVKITDVEYSWNRTHEDLSKARATGAALANGTPCDPFVGQMGAHSVDHGTAVLGEMVGDVNGFGVSGLTPSATVRTVNAASLSGTTCGWNLANAINIAANNSGPGDVVLIEQQLGGPNWTGGDYGFVPVEWDLANWTAIRQASSRGVIVIEAAGNGSQNLDDPIYKDTSGKNWFSNDSGAVVVGAGNAPGCVWGGDPTVARGRLSFSNYGSRLNAQGWGDCVYTSGYGDLQGGTNANLWYTQQFAGTSSASPIVASAAASLSSIAEARGTTLTPVQVRSMLASTGQAQAYGNAGKIGPLPNLRAAITALGPTLTDAGHRIASGSLGTTTVPVQQTWTKNTSAGVTYEVRLSTDGGAPVRLNLSAPTSSAATFQLERNHRYQFSGRAKDAAGVWGGWTNGSAFQLGEYQENYSATNPAYTGPWTRSAYTAASDGYVKSSSTAGASAKFTFTGNSIGWAATKSTSRGQAKVYVDGVLKTTVDLYTTSPTTKVVVYNTSWATSGTHTIEVRVVGTAGHPKVDVDAFVQTT